tara:strand:+ start:792 stop:1676 length:885 start_codon:yes stop_codon:yes gene_type:complete
MAIIFGFQILMSQTINQQVKDEDGKDMLVGTINKAGLTQVPFGEWFNKNHDAYAVNDKIVKQLKDSLNQYTIKAFLGTWCGDSKREVPQFYSVLELANFPMNQLEVIALDHSETAYKQGPNGEEKGMNIHRVPTFIFYKNGEEVNRIVEFPKETLERDMLKIVNHENYFPSYYVANTLYNFIEKNSLEDLKKSELSFLATFLEYSEGSKELNTLGNIYYYDKQFDKANYVFDLNSKLFPNRHIVYTSLGKLQFETKNYSEALKNYYQSLSLYPDDANALEMIEKIKAANTKDQG